MDDFTLITKATLPLPEQPARLRHFIDGAFCDSADGATLQRYSPAHGVLASVAAKGGPAEAEAAIRAARTAFDDGRWSRLPGRERARVLLRVADLIEANSERLALIETMETGKPISQSRNECGGAADLWRHAAALARTLRGDSHDTLGEDILGVVIKQPIGVVSVITPWNFPFWILSQKLPYALAAGCTCVVKPSEITPSTTAILAEFLIAAELPAGVCNIVLGTGADVGNVLSTHPDVDMVTFTGSTAVGKAITRAASDTLKKVALELGGKNPQVIMDDADLDQAADAVVFGLCFNVGQCCNSSSRIIVQRTIADAFVDKVRALIRQVRLGNPLNPDTQVGAIVTPEHGAAIDAHVRAAVGQGARLCLGGAAQQVPGLAGQFYQPTILTGVGPDMAIARDEVFGPVLAVQVFDTLDEAIALTNESSYGLSAGVWSENVHTCLEFCRRAEAGTIWTNTWMDGFPELSFGGMKQSGSGREIGAYGFEEFLEVKSLVMRIGRTRAPWVKTPSAVLPPDLD